MMRHPLTFSRHLKLVRLFILTYAYIRTFLSSYLLEAYSYPLDESI